MYEIKYFKVKQGLYQISEDGKVYSNTARKYMKTKIDKDGYITISLKNNNNGYSSFSIHRLLMVTFKPVENMENMQVNHIDGDKLNNCFSNLEWVTVVENLAHAKKLGLNQCIGETHHNASLTEEEVLLIIKRIKNNISGREIAQEFNCSKLIINQIRSGKTWTHLTKDENLMEYGLTNTKIYSTKQIELICELIVQNKNNNEILDIVFQDRAHKYRTLVCSIRNKKNHTAISNKYW